MKIKKIAKTLLRVLISGVLIIYIIKTQDFGGVLAKVFSFNIFIFILALILLCLGTLFSSLRWQEILKTSNINVGLFKLFSLYLKGYFYNNFLPTQMGGDFYKAISLSKSINNKHIAIFSVFVDRFAGLVVLLILAIYGISIKLNGYYSIGFIILALIGIFLYLPMLKFFSSKIKFLHKFYEASLLLLSNKKSASLIFLYSVLVQCMSFGMSYALFAGFGKFINLSDVLAFMPLVSLSLLLPSFNGWGAQEVVYSKLFLNSGISAPISIAVSLLIQAIRIIMSLLGGVFILFNIGKIEKSNENTKNNI